MKEIRNTWQRCALCLLVREYVMRIENTRVYIPTVKFIEIRRRTRIQLNHLLSYLFEWFSHVIILTFLSNFRRFFYSYCAVFSFIHKMIFVRFSAIFSFDFFISFDSFCEIYIPRFIYIQIFDFSIAAN